MPHYASNGLTVTPQKTIPFARQIFLLSFLAFMLFAGPLLAQTTISEVRIDQPSTDNDEYFELAGSAGSSLDGLTYLVIGDGSGGSGVIEAVVDLTGSSIPASGFFVAAEGTFTIGVADLTANLDFENNDNVTHMLVSGFTGVRGDDLDTDDDGVLDLTPWSAIEDCIALVESPASGDKFYCATTVGPDGSFVPGHSFDCPSGWLIGQFDPVGGSDSPGAANACSVVDSAPEVTNTTPADTAGGVALDANIEIGFNEDVNVSGAWFDISCNASGAHTATVSGGLQTYMLNPDSDFIASETCTVNVFAAFVTDVDADDPPDSMEADYQFSFTTTSGLIANVIINEIDYDQAGTDAAEFIEIMNIDAVAVNLGELSLMLINGNNDSVYNTINLPSVMLGPGDYFVVCGDAANVYNCDFDTSPNTNMIQNGAPDAVALLSGATLLDTVSYEGSVAAPYTEADGSGLSDSGSASFLGISRFPDGVDTDVNNADFSRRCITPGSANVADEFNCFDPAPPPLRINEIDYDQPGSDTAEFIEIINAGNRAADLSDVSLVLVNGNGGSAYTTIALPAVNLEAGDYFVLCKTAANVANCDLEGAFGSIQNGAPDAVALIRDSVVLDTVSYEGDTVAPYTEGSGVGLSDSGSSSQANRSIGRFPNGEDTDQNNVDLVNACITPGFANTSLASGCTGNGPVMEIFDIQGSGDTSPVNGQGVATLDNIVTAVGPEGFFMQTPDARADGDIDTSNGIYVFTGAAPGVAVGDQVDVGGQITEFFGFTEFSSGSAVSIDNNGNSLPAVTVFDSAVPSPDPMAPSCSIEFECYEGMLIEITGGTVTAANQGFGSDPIAEVYITAASDRTYRAPGIEFPGLPGLPEWDGNPEVFEMDADKLGLTFDYITAGSHFNAIGVLGFEFGGYELFPTSLDLTPAVLPVAVRSREIAEMTVGALNLFRLYDDIDDPDIDVIDPENPGEVIRTTNETIVDTAEYERRLTKLSTYIRTVLMAPDILAVSEVESQAVLQDLADWINTDDSSISYTAYLEEGNDIGGIDVGFLVLDTVEVDNVTQLGRFEILALDNSLLNDRPPLLLEGRQVSDGSDFPIAVIAIHGRSLGGIEEPRREDRVRLKRYEQAQSVAAKVQALQLENPDINLVVAGDFNAYEFSDSYVDVTGHMKGGFTVADNLICETESCDDLVDPNLLNQVLMIPEGERYSFIFRGNAQALDHALTSKGLDELIRDFSYGRGNSDAAVDLINDASTPLRSSDHDGLVVFMVKDSDGDGVTDDLDVCADTVIPEGAARVELGVNRWALTDDDRNFDTVAPKGRSPYVPYDIYATAGCSCEQIVAAQHLGKGHMKFGCSVGAMRNWVDLVSKP